MPTAKLSPDAIAASTNLTGAVTAIDEDPASPDANWLTATSATAATDARVSFSTPPRSPAGSQYFNLWLRKTTGTPNPTVNVSLYQGGTLRAALVTGTSITSTTGQLVTANWNSSSLVTVLDGSDVECRVEGSPGTSSGAGALPAYSAAGTVFTSNTLAQTNLALNSPTHAAGDLLIALVCCRNANNDGLLTSVNGTGGTTGWTLQNNGGSMYGGAQAARIAFGWKVAASASEICSITTTGGTTTDRISARVYRFTATNGFATPAVANVAAGTTGTLSAGQDMTMPTVAAGGATNGLAVCLYGISESSTQDAPTGATGGTWTEPVAEDAGTNATTGIFTADDSDAGGITGGTSASGATSGVWANVSLRLNPGTATTNVNTVEVGAIDWDAQYAIPTPTAWWPFDEGTSTTAADSIGTADLTLSTAAWGTGKIGPYALSLNGTTNYASVAAQANINFGTGPMSISAWVKSSTAAAVQMIADNKVAGTNNAGWNLRTNITTGYIQLRIANGTAQSQRDATSRSVTDGAWHHVAAVLIRSTSDTINLYVDGALVGTGATSAAGWNITSATPLYVGAYGTGTNAANFNGQIDDLQLFDIALTGVEVAAIYAAGNPPERGTIAAAGNAPAVSVTGSTLSPAQGTIAASGATPALTKTLAAQSGLASAVGQAPSTSKSIFPATSAVSTTGNEPALTSTILLTPQAGTAAAGGNAPSLTLDQNSTAWLFPVTTNDHSGSGSGTTPIGDGTAAWYANSNVKVADGIISYIGETNMASGVWTDWLRCLNYPNNIPSSATIRGIEVRLYIAQTSGAMTLEKISLLSAGGWLIDSLKTPAVALTGSYQLLTFGGAEDSWGVALTPALCASTTFGVGFQCSATAADTNAGIDYVQMRIHFVVPLVVGEGVVAGVGAAPALAQGIGVEAGTGVASGATPWLDLTVGVGEGAASAAGAESKLSLTFAPQEGTALAVGASPTFSLSLIPTPATVSATGNSPDASLGLTLQSGLISATGATPQLIAANNFTPAPGQVDAQGHEPSLSLGFVFDVLSGSISFTGDVPLLTFTLSAALGSATATGEQSQLTSVLALPSGTVSASGTSPTVTAVSDIIPTSGSVTVGGNTPAITWSLAGGAGVVPAGGTQPEVTRAIIPQTGLAISPGGIPNPIVIYTVTDIESAGEVWAIGNSPERTLTIIAGLEPATGVAAALGGIPDPIVIYAVTEPGDGGIVWGVGNVPGLTQTITTELTPEQGVVLGVGGTSALALELQAVGGVVAGVGNAPDVALQGTLVPQVGTVLAVGDVPTGALALGVQGGTAGAEGAAPALARGLLVQAGAANAQGAIPTITLQAASSPITGIAAFVGNAPALTLSLDAQSGTTSAIGVAPSLGVESTLTPVAGVVAASGNTPALTLIGVLSPQAGQADALGASPSRSSVLQAQAGLATATGTNPSLYIQTANTPIEGLIAASGNIPTLARQLLAVEGQTTAQGNNPQLSLTLPAQVGLASTTGSIPTHTSQLAPTVGLAAASGNIPTLSQQLVASAGLASAQGNAPAHTLTLQAVSGTVLAAGNQPTAWLQAENSPLTGIALASGTAPTLARTLASTRGIATASGTPPHVSTGLDLTPQTSLIQASGNLPPRWLAFGPAPAIATATGSAPSLVQVLALSPDGIILASGPSLALAQTLAPLAGTASAAGNEPERFVGRFIFPEAGSAFASAVEASTLTLILGLAGTTVLRAVGNAVEVQLALPGNRRETALTRLFSRLLLLTPTGILVTRNSTIPFAIPPAGAVVMLDSGPDTTDRGVSEDFYEHRVRLELFIMETNPLAKTIQDLEDEVAAILAGDRTLGGVIDQMHLLPTSSLALASGGTPIDINALSVALTYGEPHAGL